MRVFHDSVLVPKYTQRPTGRCCFYRRFVRFNTALLHSENDSLSISRKNAGYILIFEFQAVLECFADSSADHIVSMRVRIESDSSRYIRLG